MNKKNVIVALDVAGYEQAMRLAECLPVTDCRVKVGKALFTRCGGRIIEALHNIGHEVFLDLKYHDIPNTVAEAVDAAADLGVWMVNVHAQGGEAMLHAAQAILQKRQRKPLLIAVTVLTAMDAEAWQRMGHTRTLSEQVAFLTELSAANGLDGVVCSAHEASAVKTTHGQDFITVTPGIRPDWAAADDQARIMTPRAALTNGSDFLVIGRPISRAANPRAALMQVLQEIAPITQEQP